MNFPASRAIINSSRVWITRIRAGRVGGGDIAVGPIGRIPQRIESQPQAFQPLAGHGPQRGRVLAHAVGEGQDVDSAHADRQGPHGRTDAVGEHLHRQACPAIALLRRALDFGEIGRYAGNAQQAGPVVQGRVQIVGSQAMAALRRGRRCPDRASRAAWPSSGRPRG